MITVTYSIYRQHPDLLLLARNTIFEAMFERAAMQLELDIQCDRDHDYTDVYVAELNIELATQFLDLLEQVDLLAYLTVDVSTSEEHKALLIYASRTAIEVVP